MPASFASCDLCGAPGPEELLRSSRLDGPLVRCRGCGLVYVGARLGDFTFTAADAGRSAALADRVAALGIVDREVERAEFPLRELTERERLRRLREHVAGGRLLDVGAATGAFVRIAGESFDAWGIEPDPGTSAQARAAGLNVVCGTLDAAATPPGGFDAVTMFHVIEHLDSPRAALNQVRALLRPGATVLIETPTIDCLAFRLAPGRWRQLIPDHYFFFSRATLEAMLSRCGLQPVEYRKIARRVSLRFVADRLRRAGLPGASWMQRGLRAARLEGRALRVDPGDIMQVVARRSA
ncbi:MAG: class I SAM-dependent methyltransferase [Solirubrobacteraceae bacterium]